MTRDYKSTVFLPKTDFPMRAGLPAKEPEILERWEEIFFISLSQLHFNHITGLFTG